MARFRLAASALSDIDRIWGFIARDNLAAADQVANAIFDACEMLGQNPALGHAKIDLTRKPIRFWTLAAYPNYIISYRTMEDGVQILRVVHGRRNLPRVLKF
jgi:plasmid stabilization system protein ParE